MNWRDMEAIGLLTKIKDGVDVTDNYGRLIWNYTNRGNNWREREMVGLLEKIRAGTDVVDNLGRAIWNYTNRGNNWANLTITALLEEIRDGGLETAGLLTEVGDQILTEAGENLEYG